MKRSTPFFACVLFGTMFAIVWAADNTASDDSPKYSIKDVMKKAHKEGLLKKIIKNEASDAQKLMLLDLYISLIENEPPQGEIDSWYEKSGRAVVAAAKVAVGRDGAVGELESAVNCKSCHQSHKPPSE